MVNVNVEYNNANYRSPNVNIVNGSHQHNNAMNSHQHESTQSYKKGEWPLWFERAKPSKLKIQMDSKILEDQYNLSSLPQVRTLLWQSIVFVCLSCICWIIFFVVNRSNLWWVGSSVGSVILALFCVVFLVLIKRCDQLADASAVKHISNISVTFLIVVMGTVLVTAYHVDVVMSTAASFFLATEIVLLIYLIMPFPIPITFLLAVIFSIVFEVLHHVGFYNFEGDIGSSSFVLTHSLVTRITLFIALHIIGVQLVVNLQILRHSTFWKVCQVVQTTIAKKKEKEFKNLMIESVMPLSIAKEVMINDTAANDNLFRPFTMKKMENVSILYADIVGFTKMSANKNAAELVGLLNDLFGRFDRLCEETGCEKISTLGDCYYCVAGCPESNPDHAICCVEMGIGMITAIKEFCVANNISVNMRVGIHTGYVLCGIVGTRRYKFDVWSNDVSLANGMEQHGIPGRIHISQQTLDCLGNHYSVEDSKLEERDESFKEKTGVTYLIVDRIIENGHHKVTTEVKENSKAGSLKSFDNKLSKSVELNTSRQPLLHNKKSRRKSEQHKSLNINKFNQENQLKEYLDFHISPLSTPGILNKVRLDEDRRFVDGIKDDPLLDKLYENRQVNHLPITFHSPEVEQEFQGLCEKETKGDDVIGVTISTRYRYFKDAVISSVLSLLIFISSIPWLDVSAANIAIFAVFFSLLVVLAIASGMYVFHTRDLTKSKIMPLLAFLSTWAFRHMFGAFLLLIPAFILFSSFACKDSMFLVNFITITCVVGIQFLIYDQLSNWMRSVLAAIVLIIALCLVYTIPCSSAIEKNFDLILVSVLLIIFVWYINRHFELGYRLEFYSSHEVKMTDLEMEKLQKQVQKLLQNFIPEHVSKAMQDQPLYSKTHKKVGVIFGTIVNFNELYEESYEGGMQFIRYLSELISDVDDLLKLEKYKDIEKIKTIGTTFMFASGLNPNADQESTGKESHLAMLMDFCIAMQNAVDHFNEDMLNFHLVLRIGFNHGEVTAGVIGTTKRLYDIWGDTVNTASRMDSTGVSGRVQVSQESKTALENHFNFDFIGEKFVKGKGMMKTYLLVRDDEDERKIIPNPKTNYQPF